MKADIRTPKPKLRADGSLEPSQFVSRSVSQIADAASGLPIFDVACGSGRNAFPFQKLGCTVICLDKDLSIFTEMQRELRQEQTELLRPYRIDLIQENWPFGKSFAGGIINIHFFLPHLFRHFADSLISGGYLLFETPPGCGGNYFDLPKKGEIKSLIENEFQCELYREKRVGPIAHGAVTVKLLARRK